MIQNYDERNFKHPVAQLIFSSKVYISSNGRILSWLDDIKLVRGDKELRQFIKHQHIIMYNVKMDCYTELQFVR